MRRRGKYHYGFKRTGVALCGTPISRAIDDDERKALRECRRCKRIMRVHLLKDEIAEKVERHVRLMVTINGSA